MLSYNSLGDYKKLIKCANSNKHTSPILSPQCFNNDATEKLTIFYNKYKSDSDTHFLCKKCSKRLQKDVEKYGYEFKIGMIKPLIHNLGFVMPYGELEQEIEDFDLYILKDRNKFGYFICESLRKCATGDFGKPITDYQIIYDTYRCKFGGNDLIGYYQKDKFPDIFILVECDKYPLLTSVIAKKDLEKVLQV